MASIVYISSSDSDDNMEGNAALDQDLTQKSETHTLEDLKQEEDLMDVESSTDTQYGQIHPDAPKEKGPATDINIEEYIEMSEKNIMDAGLDEADEVSAAGSSIVLHKDNGDGKAGQKSEGSSKGKGKKKKNTELKKKTKKQALEEEKAAQKLSSKMNKMYKPGECMKHMNIEGHPSLWNRWYMSDVAHEAAAAGARVVQAHALCDPALIVWSRNIPRTLDKDSGNVKLSASQEPCDRALYIASAEELCELVSSHELTFRLSQVQQLCDCKLTLVVFKLKDYFKSSRRKTSNSNRTPMTEVDFELALTDLLVGADCDAVTVNTPNELALTIVQFTKAIAEAPYKKSKRMFDEQVEFYMRGDNKKCVAVNKDGAGVGSLWQQMLAVLPNSSLEVARALCAQYKSPLALYEVLQANDIVEIADIGVSRETVAGTKPRRVGPEFARKLHTLFTAQQGDVVID